MDGETERQNLLQLFKDTKQQLTAIAAVVVVVVVIVVVLVALSS